jgi:hypothetical protein
MAAGGAGAGQYIPYQQDGGLDNQPTGSLWSGRGGYGGAAAGSEYDSYESGIAMGMNGGGNSFLLQQQGSTASIGSTGPNR